MSNIAVPNLLDQFSTALIKDAVDIITFAEDPKYLGKTLYPRQRTLLKIIFLQDLDDYDKKVIKEWSDPDGEVELVPKLEERIDWLKANGYPHFRTVQIVGGRRSGKGFMTGIVIAYKVYLMTLLENAQKHYGMDEGKAIYYSIIADAMDQAKAHQFGDAANTLLDCSILQNQGLISKLVAESIHVATPHDQLRASALRNTGAKIERDMASLIVKAYGTNSKTLRGSASMMFVMDEFAHFITGESKMSDEEIWKAATPSLATFKEDAMIFANSSPYTKTGKFFELYEQAQQLDPPEDGDPVFPTHFMIRYPSWEMYKDWELNPKINGPLIGRPEDDPMIAAEERADPDSFKVEYRSNFAEVIDAFLNPEMVDRVFDPSFNREILDKDLIPQYGSLFGFVYAGHGDPATVKANFGLAVGHMEEREGEHGLEQHVVFDFIDAFYPEDFKNNTIDWLQVVPTLEELITNFRPKEFTFDQYESAQTIQLLQDKLRAKNLTETNVYSIFASAPVNDRRCKVFRTAINLGRVHAPHPSTFNPAARINSIELAKQELKFLQEKNGKVDKQSVGPIQTKDIADCMMTVVNTLIGDSILNAYSGLGGNQGAWGAGMGTPQGNTSQFPELENMYRSMRRPGAGSGLARGHHSRRR